MFEFEPQDILSANITWVFPVIWPKSLSRDVLPVNVTIILENGTHKPLKKQLIFSNQKIWLFSWVGFQDLTPLQAAACCCSVENWKESKHFQTTKIEKWYG